MIHKRIAGSVYLGFGLILDETRAEKDLIKARNVVIQLIFDILISTGAITCDKNLIFVDFFDQVDD